MLPFKKTTSFPSNLGKSNSSFKTQVKCPGNCSLNVSERIMCFCFCIQVVLYFYLLYTSFHMAMFEQASLGRRKQGSPENQRKFYHEQCIYHLMQRSGRFLSLQTTMFLFQIFEPHVNACELVVLGKHISHCEN